VGPASRLAAWSPLRHAPDATSARLSGADLVAQVPTLPPPPLDTSTLFNDLQPLQPVFGTSPNLPAPPTLPPVLAAPPPPRSVPRLLPITPVNPVTHNPPSAPPPRRSFPAPTSTSRPAPPPPASPAPPANASLSGPSSATFAGLNQDRAQGGLARLRADAGLTRAAFQHAAQMAAQDQMSHSGYVNDVNSQGVNWQGLGEVLGTNSPSPDASAINRLWMQSPEHRPIILDPQYKAIGIGWAQSDTGWWYVAAILMY
jgi:uncharacterized protein YkwD